MSILKIARMGHPVLRQVAEPVPEALFGSNELQGLVDDLLDTVEDAEGAGLAAPQVHIGLRVVALELSPERGMEVWINPVLQPTSDELLATWEGCLSVPGLRGRVRRPAAIQVSAFTPSGERIQFQLEGWPAVVAQHECDHLDGVLYVDRVDPGTLMFIDEFRRFGPYAEGEE